MAPIRQKKDEVVVLAPGTHKGEALNFDHLEDCTIFVFDVTECITIDDCKGCKFYLAPTHGSLFLRDNERCVMYAACKQYRMNNCNYIRSFVHAEGDPALDSCHHLTFGLPACGIARYPELLKEANLNPSRNKALKPHDFSANDEKVPQPRWTIEQPNDHVRMVFQSEEDEAVPDADEKDFPEEWIAVGEDGEKEVIKSRRAIVVNGQGLVQVSTASNAPKEGGRSRRDRVPRRKHLPPSGTLPLCRARTKRSDGGWQFTVTSDFPVGKTLEDYPDVTEESLTIGGGRPRNIHAPAAVVTAFEGEISIGDCFEIEYETVQTEPAPEGGEEVSGGRVQAKVIVKVEGAPPPPRKNKRGRPEKEEEAEEEGVAEAKPRGRRSRKAEAGGEEGKKPKGKAVAAEGLSVRHYVDRDFRQLSSCLEAAGRPSDTRQVLQAQMQHDPTSIIVAIEGGRGRGRIVGSIYVMFNPWQTTLYNLAVHPDCGELSPAVQELLVESAEQQCKDRGVEVAKVVASSKDKQGAEFYRSMDWENGGDVVMSKRIGSKGRKSSPRQ